MNKQARNWIPAALLLLLVVLGFWFISRQMTRDYSYTEQAFWQDIEEEEVSQVYISPNREIPTGQVTVRMKNGDEHNFYSLDVKELQDELEGESGIAVQVVDVPSDNTIMATVLPCRTSGNRKDTVGKSHCRGGRGAFLLHFRFGFCGNVRRSRSLPCQRFV